MAIIASISHAQGPNLLLLAGTGVKRLNSSSLSFFRRRASSAAARSSPATTKR